MLVYLPDNANKSNIDRLNGPVVNVEWSVSGARVIVWKANLSFSAEGSKHTMLFKSYEHFQ